MRISIVKIISLLLLLGSSGRALAQPGGMLDPIEWSFRLEKADQPGIFFWVAEADLDPGWHLYSQHLPPAELRPQPTACTFEPHPALQRIDSVVETGDHQETAYDPNFEMELTWFAKHAEFRQRFAIQSASEADTLKGQVYYMVCDDKQCLPPTEETFSLAIPESWTAQLSADPETGPTGKAQPESDPLPEAEPAGKDAQAASGMLDPISWSFRTRAGEAPGTFDLVAEATLEPGWHLYAQHLPPADIRPQPTEFSFEAPAGLERIDSVVEQGGHKETSYDPNFEMELTWYGEQATFTQTWKLISEASADSIRGNVYFMVCDDQQCLPPTEVSFAKAIPPTIQAVNNASPDQVQEAREGWWLLFGKGFLGGLLALLTPCVFPMIPLTVSFFTKQSGGRTEALRNALLYSLSIVVLYVSLGFIITVAFGADSLNALASNGIFNFAFFLLLVVFAISFFGAFEITLPHQWVNSVQSQTGKGGFLGIFFMAATLALVSFSCTGPIIGTLLVDAATGGSRVGPVVGMTGFSLALALPFGLFALFPSALRTLPKSGGWLNSVKVVLGFLELGFSLKFLSNVDLAYHWEWLDREVFLSLWIIISGLLGLYLLGKLRLPHDSPIEKLSVPRLLLAIITLSFTVYLLPGLWGAPLKAVSAFLPPQGSQDFDLSRLEYMVADAGRSPSPQSREVREEKQYADLFHCPHNLDCFFDYEQGMAYARRNNKPVMLDFTGHACVNCRKMEASVWSDPAVHDKLKNDYVLISLYVDDKSSLPDQEQYVSEFSGKKIKTLGAKWSDIQAQRFGANSQPYYVLLDPQGNVLTKPRGYNENIRAYLDFLNTGLQRYEQQKQNTADRSR